MAASTTAHPTERADECSCPSVARRGRLDGVDLARLEHRASQLRFPAPVSVAGAVISSPSPDAPSNAPMDSLPDGAHESASMASGI